MLVEELENATYMEAREMVLHNEAISGDFHTFPEGNVLVIYVGTGNSYKSMSGKVIVKRRPRRIL